MSQKNSLKSYRKERGKGAPVRVKLEHKLVEFGIERESYHGGDLSGVKVIVLFQKMDKIFKGFDDILIQVDNKPCEDIEVRDMIKRYIELGFLFTSF